MGVPVGFVSDYIAPAQAGGEFAKNIVELPITPGFFGPFGREAVSDEVLKGTSTQVTDYKDRAAVTKYRAAHAAHKVAELTTDDLLALSKACLEATESPAAKKLDSKADQVARPNHYAVIDIKHGFHWVAQ